MLPCFSLMAPSLTVRGTRVGQREGRVQVVTPLPSTLQWQLSLWVNCVLHLFPMTHHVECVVILKPAGKGR